MVLGCHYEAERPPPPPPLHLLQRCFSHRWLIFLSRSFYPVKSLHTYRTVLLLNHTPTGLEMLRRRCRHCCLTFNPCTHKYIQIFEIIYLCCLFMSKCWSPHFATCMVNELVSVWMRRAYKVYQNALDKLDKKYLMQLLPSFGATPLVSYLC